MMGESICLVKTDLQRKRMSGWCFFIGRGGSVCRARAGAWGLHVVELPDGEGTVKRDEGWGVFGYALKYHGKGFVLKTKKHTEKD